MAATARSLDRDGAHGLSHGHGPVPGSPTLTNPDMILPDYEVPDSPGNRSHSPLELWNDPNIGRMDFQLPPQHYGAGVGPSTPIIYGNGTMLSDIGEVTEVESTVGPNSRRTSSRYSMNTDEGETYGASIINQANYRASRLLARNRRASVGSNSTITTLDHGSNVHEFDDVVSVDDSNFQGDDEESIAESYVGGISLPQKILPGAERKVSSQGQEPYSTAYISERAEEILANAKRRLTAMEGNLTRARSSLAYSPNSDGSMPSPRVVTNGAGFQDSTSNVTSHHSRIRSEDGIRVITKSTSFVPRSASALGSAGGYRPRHDSNTRGGYGASHKFSHPTEKTLEPLSEDERDGEGSSPGESIRSSYLSGAFGPDGLSDRPLSRSASVAQMRDIQDQMQGLKGKISSLKEQARADSLKRRSLQSLRTPSPFTHARWESGMMEPREIRGFQSGSGSSGTPRQSGDFPQATTAPEAADRGVEPSQHSATMLEAERPVVHNPTEEHRPDINSVAPPIEDTPESNDTLDTRPMTPTAKLDESKARDEVDDGDDFQTENGDVTDISTDGEEAFVDSRDDDFDWESESGESTYHDSFQHQLSHEDREDAFDYEHFFLHSAMGSMSRQRSRRRGSLESFESSGSEESVETTKGPVRESPRKRRSVDTNASDDSFETATEGRASRTSEFQDAQSGRESVDEARDSHTGGQRQRQNSVLYRPMSAASGTGTNRSFPLVNRTKMNGGVLTPGGSPDHNLFSTSESLLSDAASLMAAGERKTTLTSSADQLQNLQREDQIAVERLVASLGKCVLALGEGSRAGAEARIQRRRIDLARRILEGLDES